MRVLLRFGSAQREGVRGEDAQGDIMVLSLPGEG